ncbi:Transposon Ty3-G Gag-Pol polyprotein [Labeo rohita]|uniref:ribonuclease H n=1 Tax=Labeo rohita TaxID=84645 RepID=A0ABQ8MMF6_LABRO|nr:Transposon Ty3-G Gag-Pol polyprotein [Labeo rohita]
MSKASRKSKHLDEPRFRACVPPCPRFITGKDTHALCVVCLGAEHAAAALEGADCPHCVQMSLHTLRSRKALFQLGAFSSVPRGSGPASAEAGRRLHSWGSQLDLAEGMETDPQPGLWVWKPALRILPPRGTGSTLPISSSEEVDVESVGDVQAPSFPQYEELLEVVTRAHAGAFLFFPDLHTEVSRSWNNPFSSRLFIPASYNYGHVGGLDERGYRAMPRVEQTLASYLSPAAASSLKAPVLPSKPLRVTSALVGKGYTAAGQAGACLHTMSVLQAYQADLLKELDEGAEIRDCDISELRRTADLSLRATKETARAIGRSMASLVAAERHLWLTLSDMKEKDRVFLLDAPLSPSGLFGDAVNAVVDRYQEARKQAAAFQRFLPRRRPTHEAAELEQPRPRTSSSHRETQKQSVATRTPPHRGRVRRRSSLGGPRPSGPDGAGPLRVAPSGEFRGAPHYSVSGSPLCPREAVLPTLPVIQGAAASGELSPQSLPARDVPELGGSPPLRGSQGPLDQVLPAGQPLQDTGLATRVTPEASLERLVPLVDHLAAWKLLPNVSAWVLHTVERGYRIQFGASPPPFNGVFPTLVGPEQGLVMEQEVATLLRKEAIEVVPPQFRESGFYSRYFIVPKKDGGLRPILDLRLLNRSVMRLKFRMLTVRQVVSQIRSEDWFVTIDLKDAYFHVSILPQHRKFLRFAFRGEAYQYRVLPFGLALSPRTFTKCVDAALAPLRLQGIRILNYIDDWLILAQSEMVAVRHRDVVLAHMKELGLRLNAKKSVLSPVQRTTYLGVVWDSTTMQAQLSPARIESILAAVMRVKEGRSLTVKQFQRLLGLMAAASNVIPFGLLYMRPLQWWLKTRGSPEGKPASHDQGHAAMPSCLRHVEETLVLVSGPGAGSSLSPCNASDGRIPHWLGSGHEWPPCPRSVEWSPSQLAHKLPGDAGRVSRAETLSPGPERSPRVGPHRQHGGGLLHQPPRRSAFAPLVQAGAPDPCVVPGQTPLTESSFCARVSQCGSRRPVETGAEARGMDASPRGGEADLESVWSSPGGPVCHEGQCTMSPLVLSSSSSSTGAGCHGTDVAEAASVRFSPDRSAPGSSRESAPGWGFPSSSSPVLAGPSMVLGPDFPPRRLSLGDSRQEGSPLTGRGFPPSPPAGAVEALGVASEGAHLLASGLSTEVVETLLQSRAPSTRKLYALKWKLFTSWCGRRQQNPVNCPVGSVLEFLQDRLSAGLSHSTLKVYVAAIAAYHAPLGGLSVGKNPLVTRFLRGALRLRPPVRPRVPSWDLSVVLDALCLPPFEPIEEISDCHLSFKTSFLLALSSLKRVGDLQALSVAPSFLDFAPGLSKAFLHPRTGYVPKVPSFAPRPVVLQAFCPPPFREPDQQKLNCMCPVRALDAYVHRVATWRRSDQLFVCFGPQRRGLPASKQTISRWIVEAILLAYESSGLPPPLGVKAHSTRSMAASKSFLAGIPLQDICNAAALLGRDLELVAWASRSHSVFRRGSSSRRGTSQVTYVTLVPRGNETPRLEASFLRPCERCFSLKLPFILAHVLLCFLVCDVTPVTSRSSIGLISHVFRARSRWRRSHSVFRRGVSFPRGTRVTYVT